MLVVCRRGCGARAQYLETGLRVASPGKVPNSEFQVWFLLNAYPFHTIVTLKIVKVGHLKLGILCT